MNMSYCRFQNTLKDLRDCHDNINEEVSSDEEEYARKKLVELCQVIVDEFDPPEEDECFLQDEDAELEV